MKRYQLDVFNFHFYIWFSGQVTILEYYIDELTLKKVEGIKSQDVQVIWKKKKTQKRGGEGKWFLFIFRNFSMLTLFSACHSRISHSTL